jgi:hypothetical protein
MEKSGKRGKIPQQDWPSIIARYEAGETLSSIARTYDCSPPAISYIISRSRARNAAAESPPPATEPQLVKIQAGPPAVDGPPTNGAAAEPSPPSNAATDGTHDTVRPIGDSPDAVAASMPPSDRFGDNAPALGANGAGHRQVEARDPRRPELSGDAVRTDTSGAAGPERRTLRLGGPPGGDGGRNPEPQPQEPRFQSPPATPHEAMRPAASEYGGGQPAKPPYGRAPGADFEPPRAGKEKDGAFIDRALRERVDGDIEAFLAAFDAALAQDTTESRAGLREATDRLLRAGARTRIELERLEARMPLTPRERVAHSPPHWRPR